MIKFFHIENDDNSTTCMPTQGIANTFRFHFLSSINFFIIVFSFLCALCRVFRNISCYSFCLFAILLTSGLFSSAFLNLLFILFLHSLLFSILMAWDMSRQTTYFTIEVSRDISQAINMGERSERRNKINK